MANWVEIGQDCLLMEGDKLFSPFAVPSPRELDLQLSADSVDFYKKSDCLRYLKCLDVAADEGWQQFHCRECRAYEQAVRDEDDKALLTKLSMFFRGD